MLFAQEHVRMLFERTAGYRVIVFRADGNKNAPLPELQGQPLNGQKRFSLGIALPNKNAFQPIIPDHSAPNRIVEVEHQAFACLAANGPEQPSYRIGIDRAAVRGKRELVRYPLERIEPSVDPDPFGQGRGIEQITSRFLRQSDDGAIAFINQSPQRAADSPIIAAEDRIGRHGHGL